MKFKQISLTLAAALAFGLASCSKDEPVTVNADEANKAADSTADAAAKTAEAAKAEAARTAEAAKVEAAKIAEAAKAEAANAEAARTAEAAKAEAAKTAEAANAQATKTAEAANAQATKTADNAKTQGWIDKAKSLIAEGKFADASNVLQQLAGQSLSEEQTKLVDGLKEQINKALAAKAAGDLLKK